MQPSLVAVAALLWARRGRSVIAAADVEASARALPEGSRVERNDVEAIIAALVRANYLSAASDRAWNLTAHAIESLAVVADNGLSLSPDEQRQLLELIQQNARGGSIRRDDLHTVTRRFLEDVLAGAVIPDEILDRIVEAYADRGRLVMSEDGGKYTITLGPP